MALQANPGTCAPPKDSLYLGIAYSLADFQTLSGDMFMTLDAPVSYMHRTSTITAISTLLLLLTSN